MSRRRSRYEIQLARFVRVGQQWRRRDDGSVWTVAQVWRTDSQLLLRRLGDWPTIVRFEHLKADWKWIAAPPRPKESPAA